jgi:hypothetical protein
MKHRLTWRFAGEEESTPQIQCPEATDRKLKSTETEVLAVSGTPESLILVPLDGHQNGAQKETPACKEGSA